MMDVDPTSPAHQTETEGEGHTFVPLVSDTTLHSETALLVHVQMTHLYAFQGVIANQCS